MLENPSQEWQRLTEHYRSLYDGELEQITGDFKDLTQTAQEVLRNEMRNRGLADPAAPPKRVVRPELPAALPVDPLHIAGDVDPEDYPGGQRETDPAEESDGEREYTWKTPLMDCDDREQALMLKEVLRRAGIESWVQSGLTAPRLLVAADQLDEALEIAGQPIPRDVVELISTETPEYVAPKCPQCGAEDPVLESAEPVNSWLCEACGKEWTEPAVDPQ
jgi:hypothetical protein